MNRAEKILERMRQTKGDWKPRDFRILYTGFGFEEEEGANHTLYTHPIHKIMATVARHTPLATGYAATAVKNIDKVLSLEAQPLLNDTKESEE